MNRSRPAARVASLRPTAVNQVLREAQQLQAEGRELVSLMRGQPDTPTPDFIIKAANQALREGRTGYADNQGELPLRRAVATRLARDYGLMYDPEREVLITDGATAGICTALGSLLEPGDEVLLPDPIYDAYSGPITLWGGRPVSVRATLRDDRFTIDRAALDAAVTPQSRVLLLNTPWNPVGTVFTEAELREILAFATAHDLFVISDEIYETFVYDDRRHVSPASISTDARRRTLIVNSLSKTFAMTGWRVGYCAGPPEVIRAMLLVWQQFSRGPATFVQDAAACALNAVTDFPRQQAAEYQERRDCVLRVLDGIPGVRCLVPQGGLFVMVDVAGLGLSSDEVRRRLLYDAGVVLIHGAAYGPGGEGTVRVSFAAGKDLENKLVRLRSGLQRLAERIDGKGTQREGSR